MKLNSNDDVWISASKALNSLLVCLSFVHLIGHFKLHTVYAILGLIGGAYKQYSEGYFVTTGRYPISKKGLSCLGYGNPVGAVVTL